MHGARLHSLFASTTERADAAIFADLLSGLDQSYAEVDAVFQANGLASRETPLNDARMRFDVSKGMCLEMFANKVLPFDMHTTATVAWQHFIFGKQRTPSRFYDFISTPVSSCCMIIFCVVVQMEVGSLVQTRFLLGGVECGDDRRHDRGEFQHRASCEKHEWAFTREASAPALS